MAFNLIVGIGFSLAYGSKFGWRPGPVFLGLDVLIVWLAFRANYRAARRRERVRVSAEQVEIWLESEAGKRTVWTSPTAFTGLDVEPFGQDDTKVRLRMHRKRYLVGRALSPGERADLGRALDGAIRAARKERYPDDRKNRVETPRRRTYLPVMAYDMTQPSADIVSLDDRARDYHRMEKALAWLADHWQDHPSLDDAAEAVGLSPFHFQRIFTRWAGVSPKTFVGAIAHAEARRSLEQGASVLDAAYDAGLSGPSRLHDLFIAQEAVTPGDARRRGEGLNLRWGFAPTPFGRGLFVVAPRGLAGLGFAGPGEEDAAFADMHRRFPAADWVRDDAAAQAMSRQAFAGEGGRCPSC